MGDSLSHLDDLLNLAMAFRCGQNIQIAKCYSKSKKLVEMYKI